MIIGVSFKNLMQPVFKVFMCLILAFLFLFVQPREQVKEAEAAVIAGWVMAVVGSIVIDVAIDMGIKFVDKMAQTKLKETVVADIWSKHSDDIKKLKPTKKNGLKWLLKAPKWLKSVIIGSIGATTAVIVDKAIEKEEDIKPVIQVEGLDSTEVKDAPVSSIENATGSNPFYNTAVKVKLGNVHQKSYDYVVKYAYIKFQPLAYKQENIVSICMDNECASTIVPGGRVLVLEPYGYTNHDYYGQYIKIRYSYENYVMSKYDIYNNYNQSAVFGSKIPLFEAYVANLNAQNEQFYEFDGIIVNKAIKSVVELPVGIKPEQIELLPNDVLPVGYHEKEYEFNVSNETVLQQFIEGDTFDIELIEQDIVQLGDNIHPPTANYTYNTYIPTINNNYYVDESKNEEIVQRLMQIIEDNPVVDDGEGNEIIVGGMDRGLLAFVKNAYEYATDTILVGVNGLKELATSASAITQLYEVFFGWLPREIRTLMVGGFSMVVGVGIFRAFRR